MDAGRIEPVDEALPQLRLIIAEHLRGLGSYQVPIAAGQLPLQLPARPTGMAGVEAQLTGRFVVLDQHLQHPALGAEQDVVGHALDA